MLTLREQALTKNMFIAAHQGSSGTSPENTIAAFREALDAGANMIETDVQITLDGHIITYHNHYIEKKNKIKKYIDELKYEDIKSINIGAWFNEKYIGEKIPLLEQVIELVKDNAYLVLELKSYRNSNLKQNLKKIVDLISKNNYDEYTLFASFDYNLLLELININPGLHTAALKIPGDERLPSKIAKEIRCDAFICSLNEIDNFISDDARRHLISLGVYSVDTEKQFQFIKQFHINAIGTNFPERIIELMNKK